MNDMTSVARWLAGVLLLALVVASGVRAGAMDDCVAEGGTYFEDGPCEVGRDDSRKACLRQGGRFLSNGDCQIRRDPVKECKEAGGDGMTEGHCWRAIRPGDRP
jgi:hypothetical protein